MGSRTRHDGLDIELAIEENGSMATENRRNRRDPETFRDRGTGCLRPPRDGITKYWYGQVWDDKRGKLVSHSLRITGEFKAGVERTPENLRNPKFWSNRTAANEALNRLKQEVQGGTSATQDRSLRYADLRKIYLDYYQENKRKSLRKDPDGVAYTNVLPHLDEYFGFTEDEPGMRVSNIVAEEVKRLKKELLKQGYANATVNRSSGSEHDVCGQTRHGAHTGKTRRKSATIRRGRS
jgi:hypothetical protein